MCHLYSTNFYHLLFFTFLKIRTELNVDNISWMEGVLLLKYAILQIFIWPIICLPLFVDGLVIGVEYIWVYYEYDVFVCKFFNFAT